MFEILLLFQNRFQIVDKILYDSDSPFKDQFEEVGNSPDERILKNDTTREYLRINTDDFIFAVKVNDNFDETFNRIKSTILPFVENEIFKDFKINNINRIGIVFHKSVKDKGLMHELVSGLTNKNITKGENISFTFSKKIPTMEGAGLSKVGNYKNVIVNISQLPDRLLAELDFQYYFVPVIQDIRECKAKNILDDGKDYLESKFDTWIKKYESEK